MRLFYGRLCWTKVEEGHELKLLIVQETVEQMDMLKDWLREAHDRQKIYAAKRRKDLELHMAI